LQIHMRHDRPFATYRHPSFDTPSLAASQDENSCRKRLRDMDFAEAICYLASLIAGPRARRKHCLYPAEGLTLAGLQLKTKGTG